VTGCGMFSVVVPRFGWDIFRVRVHLLWGQSLGVSRAVAVKCCNVMLEFCVLWVLLDSREACFFFTYVYGECGL